jgi:hypothetical protein
MFGFPAINLDLMPIGIAGKAGLPCLTIKMFPIPRLQGTAAKDHLIIT